MSDSIPLPSIEDIDEIISELPFDPEKPVEGKNKPNAPKIKYWLSRHDVNLTHLGVLAEYDVETYQRKVHNAKSAMLLITVRECYGILRYVRSSIVRLSSNTVRTRNQKKSSPPLTLSSIDLSNMPTLTIMKSSQTEKKLSKQKKKKTQQKKKKTESDETKNTTPSINNVTDTAIMTSGNGSNDENGVTDGNTSTAQNGSTSKNDSTVISEKHSTSENASTATTETDASTPNNSSTGDNALKGDNPSTTDNPSTCENDSDDNRLTGGNLSTGDDASPNDGDSNNNISNTNTTPATDESNGSLLDTSNVGTMQQLSSTTSATTRPRVLPNPNIMMEKMQSKYSIFIFYFFILYVI